MPQKNNDKSSTNQSGVNAKLKTTSSPRNLIGRYHEDDKAQYAVTIGVPLTEVFAFFRDFSNFPAFMKDIKEVTVASPKKSHWVVEASNGLTAKWDAEITSERTNEMIAWRSTEGSEIQTSGAVFFSPAPEALGTVVSLSLDYKIPGGKLIELVTFLTGDNPSELAFVNLRRLKAYLETGEIPTIKGQPSGREPDAETVVKH